MSDRTRTKEAEAAKRGHLIVTPLANQLFIDIDSEAGHKQFDAALPIFDEIECIEDNMASVSIAPSSSGEPHHFHITVNLTRDLKSEEERLMFQAMLGSDPMREILSYRELRWGDANPTIFFEKYAEKKE